MLFSDLETNQKFESFFMIKRIEIRTARNNKNYVDLTLSDKSKDEINGKIWNADSLDMDEFRNGTLVKVRASVQNYKDSKQLIIDRIRVSKDSDQVDIYDYIEAAPIVAEDMIATVYRYIDMISNSQIKKLTRTLFDMRKDRVAYYPAAKTHHHNIKSGLLYHITTMLKMGEMIGGIYDFLNKDLLFSGIVLHDLMKVEEMESNEIGVVEDYSFKGKLLGHIIQGINEVERVADDLNIDSEVKVLIQHMILSHHYQPEYGSPKKPLFPEAELLHYLDIIDARMYAMEKSLFKTEPGEFTERNYTLENRSLYKHNLPSGEEGDSE